MHLRSQISKIIAKQGYITIDQFMREANSKNSTSYYKQDLEIGEKGDFITSPEISQIFGEIIAIWIIEQYIALNPKSKIILLELGPGKGTLQFNILRTLKIRPTILQNIELYLLEINKFFIKFQKNLIDQFNIKAKWIENLSQLPKNKPIIIIANEFFDTLPIKQYIKKKDRWREVTIVNDLKTNKLKFSDMLINQNLEEYLCREYDNATDEAIVEESPESVALIQNISSYLKKYRGSALIIDYGYNLPTRTNTQFHSTLQAVSKHKYVSILENLEQFDITAHLNFKDLKKTLTSNDIEEISFTNQKEFLIQNGILQRLEDLKSKNDKIYHKILDKQVLRLIQNDQMGSLFKVLEFKVLSKYQK